MGWVILGTLAAFGALCALWAVFGCFLAKDKDLYLVCRGKPGEETLAYLNWLRGLGILRCPLIVAEEPEMKICDGEGLLSPLEWEKNRFNGTGDGDHSGHHQRGGVPEL